MPMSEPRLRERLLLAICYEAARHDNKREVLHTLVDVTALAIVRASTDEAEVDRMMEDAIRDLRSIVTVNRHRVKRA